MKTTILILIVTLFYTNVSAQAFTPGSSFISVGYGLGSVSIIELNPFNEVVVEKITGPFFLKYEYAIAEKWGMGLNLAFENVTYSYYLSYDSSGYTAYKKTEENFNKYSLLARINYHFGDLKKFDPYFGMGLGYRNIVTLIIEDNLTTTIFSDGNTPFGFELTIGARYFFTPGFGIYTEFGLAKAPVQAGLVFKFGSAKKDIEIGSENDK